MTITKPPEYEIHGFLISMPFIGLYVHYILYGERAFHDPLLWLGSFPVLFVLAVGSWYMHFLYHSYITSLYPGLQLSGKRIFFKAWVYPLVMIPSIILIHAVYAYFNLFGYEYNSKALKLWMIQGVVVNLIFESLWEVVYIIQQYKENLTEKELLQQMKTEQEFENLKAQVNPHFLFNCFNTLSGLIADDREKAEQFLSELSKVYRYLLNSHSHHLTTLHNELKFIQSFLGLLTTRYGPALQVEMDVKNSYHNYLIPSLSLQITVENAVKHNVVSKKEPLCISIYTDDHDRLIVQNNLQEKQRKESSTGIGLKNIRAKYTLLQRTDFEAGVEGNDFVVKLPLIKELHAQQLHLPTDNPKQTINR